MIRFRGSDLRAPTLQLPRGTSTFRLYLGAFSVKKRGVAQLVARTAGGRKVASSSLVIPTKQDCMGFEVRLERLFHLVINHFFGVYGHVQVD